MLLLCSLTSFSVISFIYFLFFLYFVYANPFTEVIKQNRESTWQGRRNSLSGPSPVPPPVPPPVSPPVPSGCATSPRLYWYLTLGYTSLLSLFYFIILCLQLAKKMSINRDSKLTEIWGVYPIYDSDNTLDLGTLFQIYVTQIMVTVCLLLVYFYLSGTTQYPTGTNRIKPHWIVQMLTFASVIIASVSLISALSVVYTVGVLVYIAIESFLGTHTHTLSVSASLCAESERGYIVTRWTRAHVLFVCAEREPVCVAREWRENEREQETETQRTCVSERKVSLSLSALPLPSSTIPLSLLALESLR